MLLISLYIFEVCFMVVRKCYSKKYKQIKVFSKSNGGKGSAQNLGIKKSTGEIVAITDSDCVVKKDWLSIIDSEMSEISYLQGVCLPKENGSVLQKIQYSEFLVNVKYSKNKIEKQIARTRTEESSPKNTTLYFSLLLETKDLVTALMNLMEEYYTSYKKA